MLLDIARPHIQLEWVKKGTFGAWHKLHELYFEHFHFDNMSGVYVIRSKGINPRVIRVGQGNIKDRLRMHITDPEIESYGIFGNLEVTWALVIPALRDGIEKYLADFYVPVVGRRLLNTNSISVNLP